MKPIIKWMGGKRKLLTHYKKHGWNPDGRILEPFCGSAAISLDTNHDFIINDSNSHLINFYNVIKNMTDSDVKSFINDFYSHEFTKEEFYEYRDKQYELTSNYNKASWFFYINRVGFNGLWRVNSKGKVNVAFGDPLNSWSGFKEVTEENLLQFRDKIKNKQITNIDGIEFINTYAKQGDWIFVDPPYDKTEDMYTEDGWSREKLIRLKDAMSMAEKIGCNVIHTNANTDFVKELFADHQIIEIGRMGGMNSDASKRQTVKELMIRI